jgi:hypothetical protein
VEIACRANYNRDNRVPDPLDANNPVQATKLRQMHNQELLRRAHYDQDNGPPDDLYIIRRPMPRQLVLARSTTSRRSHVVLG